MADDSRRTLHIDLIVDGEGKVVGAMERVERAGNQAADSGAMAATAISTGFLAVLAVGDRVLGFMGRLSSEVSALADESAEARRGIGDLSSALYSHGNLTKESLTSLQDWSLTMQRFADQDADELISALAKIEHQTGLNADSLDEAGRAAIQVSEIFDTDLQAAAKLVSTAVEGSDRIFKKFGVTVREGATEEERLNALLHLTAGGMIEAMSRADQYEGAQDLLNRTWGDFREELGNFVTGNPALIDALQGVSDEVAGITDAIKDWRDEHPEEVAAIFQTIGLAAVDMSLSIAGAANVIEDLGTNKFFTNYWQAIKNAFKNDTNVVDELSLLMEGQRSGENASPLDKAIGGLNSLREKIQNTNYLPLPEFTSNVSASIDDDPSDLLTDNKKKRGEKKKPGPAISGWSDLPESLLGQGLAELLSGRGHALVDDGISALRESVDRLNDTMQKAVNEQGSWGSASPLTMARWAAARAGVNLTSALSESGSSWAIGGGVRGAADRANNAIARAMAQQGSGWGSAPRRSWRDQLHEGWAAFTEDDNLMSMLATLQGGGGIKDILGGIGGAIGGAPGSWLGRKLGGIFGGGGGDRRAERGTRENPMITRSFELEDKLDKLLNVTRANQIQQQGAFFNAAGDQLRMQQGLTPGRL